MNKASRNRLRDKVIAECVPGGSPAQAYIDLNAAEQLTEDEAGALTTAIWVSMEQRLIAVERSLSLKEP